MGEASCPDCDRADCAWYRARTADGFRWPGEREVPMIVDCEAHAVDWRARALRLETDLAHERGRVEGAGMRISMLEAARTEWEQRAVAAEANAVEMSRFDECAIEQLEARVERTTIERVAAAIAARYADIQMGTSMMVEVPRVDRDDLLSWLCSGAWRKS